MLDRTLTYEQREELEAKMEDVFKEDIDLLSRELQRILVDDLVTAFQNRMKVLIRAQDRELY
ncbi:MAG: hypothetical protein ACOC6H_03235 [Thermoproteota archaeon]